jgi:hypothetical protein
MTLTRRTLLASPLAAPGIVQAQGTEPIRIGEVTPIPPSRRSLCLTVTAGSPRWRT